MYSHHQNVPNQFQDTDTHILAHMTPGEIHELNRLQGTEDIDHGTRYPSYDRLWSQMNHPEVFEKIVDWGRKGYSNGGHVGGLSKAFENAGINGDSRMVKLPVPLANLFDHALNGGRKSINPNTGRRQYFLGGLLGSLSNIVSPFMNVLKPIAGKALQTFAPALGGLAQQGISALGNSFGMRGVGNAVGSMANSAVSGLANDIGGDLSNQRAMNPGQYARNAGATAVQTAAPMAAQGMQNQMNHYAQMYHGTPAHAPFMEAASSFPPMVNDHMNQFSNYIRGGGGSLQSPRGDYLTEQNAG